MASYTLRIAATILYMVISTYLLGRHTHTWPHTQHNSHYADTITPCTMMVTQY